MGVVLRWSSSSLAILVICGGDRGICRCLDSCRDLAIRLETDVVEAKLEKGSSVCSFAVWHVVGLSYPGNFERAFLLLLDGRGQCCGEEQECYKQDLKSKHVEGRDRLATVPAERSDRRRTAKSAK